MTDSAGTSPTTQAATRCSTVAECESKLQTALERLDKTLDAYENATAAISTRDARIEAMKIRDDLKNQYLAIKDQMIAAQAQLITFYEKRLNVNKSKLRQLIEKVEKVLIFAAGVYIGKGV